MTRQLVNSRRLLEILNDRMHEHDECRECYFLGEVGRLRCPDPEGCNWNQVQIKARCSERSAESCRGIAERVIAEVAQEYNLEA